MAPACRVQKDMYLQFIDFARFAAINTTIPQCQKTVRMSFKGILDQMKSSVMKGYDCSTCKVSSKMSVLKASCRILQVKQSAIRLQDGSTDFPGSYAASALRS